MNIEQQHFTLIFTAPRILKILHQIHVLVYYVYSLVRCSLQQQLLHVRPCSIQANQIGARFIAESAISDASSAQTSQLKTLLE